MNSFTFAPAFGSLYFAQAGRKKQLNCFAEIENVFTFALSLKNGSSSFRIWSKTEKRNKKLKKVFADLKISFNFALLLKKQDNDPGLKKKKFLIAGMRK